MFALTLAMNRATITISKLLKNFVFSFLPLRKEQQIPIFDKFQICPDKCSLKGQNGFALTQHIGCQETTLFLVPKSTKCGSAKLNFCSI